MRNLRLKSLFVITVLSIAFIGCKKEDEDEAVKKNSFTYDSKSYDTPKGYIEDYGANEDNQSADFDVVFCSSSISYNATEEQFIGKGNLVSIDLNSSSLTELVSGTYTYDASLDTDDNATRKPDTFVYATVLADYDFANGTGTQDSSGENTKGSVIINKTESTYEISYNFTLETGKNVEGFYKGTLKAI